MSELLEYQLPINAYANFDAVSLKQFIIDRLNENPKFVDQNYEGSNLAAFVDIIAYSYHVLLFYLNQTSSETLFTQTSIYENINRIVKLLNYKPVGKRTSLATVECLAKSSLNTGNYTLRKYSYLLIDNIQFNIINNFSFDKTLEGEDEDIQSIKNELVLYQGSIQEYPLYTAEGIDYETLPIVSNVLNGVDDDRFISHGTIGVYVKEVDTNTWYAYTESENLYLSDSNSRIYDLRFNENSCFEVKFGNGVFGRRLKRGDVVAIYYILSDGERGVISNNVLSENNKLYMYNTPQFKEIYEDTNILSDLTLIDKNNNSSPSFINRNPSSAIRDQESVDEIKQNTPLFINENISLTNESEYDNFVYKNLSNIVGSIKTVGNTQFINEYIDYFYKICIDPNKTNRVIVNQLNFATSCNFNNVNIFCVPNFTISNDEDYPPFLPSGMKKLLIDLVSKRKMISHEIIPRDPVYMAFDIGYTEGTVDKNIYFDSYIKVLRDSSIKISKESIKEEIINQIINFFSPSNNKLGNRLEISELTSKILSIKGVKSIKTMNNQFSYNGLSFVSWNPLYEGVDTTLVFQPITLPFFKFPYFYRPNNLTNKIIILDNE